MLVDDFYLRFEGNDTTKRIELYLRHKDNFYHNHLIGSYTNKTKLLRINFNKNEHAFFSELLTDFARNVDTHFMNVTEKKMFQDIVKLYTKQRVGEIVLTKMYETFRDNERKIGNNKFYALTRQFEFDVSQKCMDTKKLCALAYKYGEDVMKLELTSDCNFFRDCRSDEELRFQNYIYEQYLIPALSTQMTELTYTIQIWIDTNSNFLRMHNLDIKFRSCGKCSKQSTHLMSCGHNFCSSCIFDAMNQANYLKLPYKCFLCKTDKMFVPDATILNVSHMMERFNNDLPRSAFEPICELADGASPSSVASTSIVEASKSVESSTTVVPAAVEPVASTSKSTPIAKSKNHPSKKFKQTKITDSKSPSKSSDSKSPSKSSADKPKAKQSKTNDKSKIKSSTKSIASSVNVSLNIENINLPKQVDINIDKSTSNSNTVNINIDKPTSNSPSVADRRRRRVLSSSSDDDDDDAVPNKVIKTEPVWDSERIKQFNNADPSCIINIDSDIELSDNDSLDIELCREQVKIILNDESISDDEMYNVLTRPSTPVVPPVNVFNTVNIDNANNNTIANDIYSAETRPSTPTAIESATTSIVTTETPTDILLPCNPDHYKTIKQELVDDIDVLDRFYSVKADIHARDPSINVDEQGNTTSIVTPIDDDDDDVQIISCKRNGEDIDLRDVTLKQGFPYVAKVNDQYIEKVGIKSEYIDPHVLSISSYIQSTAVPKYGKRVCVLRNAINANLMNDKANDDLASTSNSSDQAMPSISASVSDAPISAVQAESTFDAQPASLDSGISNSIEDDVNNPFIRLGPDNTCIVFDEFKL
ncbi:HOAR [Alphabaculovirus altermyunipunctae]|uniref:HOAR n=1 Tax=Mythimna unipuncta nucleopolyhedrovirus TaxID=447897 RepID=A0A346TPE3_9ABAC|nr:HOAR [Mythimna unipuncta nucleopolyhedrovirus]AXU41453.1 HOAR [Mythimna unipuncta nucleopolyhedrovirus]